MVAEWGWVCLQHNTFMLTQDDVNSHISSLPSMLEHHITDCAHITSGSSFPPSGPSVFNI